MNEKMRNQYNTMYASEKVVFGNGEPTKAVQKIQCYLEKGTVLDIGGGEGRNALYLAERGFSVTVSDISPVGIEKLKEAAKQKGVEIDTVVSDVVEEGINGTYDSVILSFVLHHIDKEDAVKLISESKKNTNDGGVHVITTFGNKGDLYELCQHTKRFYPDSTTLKDLYSDWDIQELSEHETTTKAKNDQGENMKNITITLIAIKNT